MSATAETARPRHGSAGVLRVAGVVGIEAGSVLALHQLGRYPWMRVDWAHLGDWLETSAPEDVVLGLARTVGLVLAWWLLLSTLLYLAAAVTGAPRALRSIGWVMLPVVRRLLDGALAVSIAGSATLTSSSTTLAAVTPAVDSPSSRAPAARPPESVGLKLAIYPARAPLPAPAQEAATYEVRAGDSLWEIAESQLGDPGRWSEIWELNQGRLEVAGATNPNVLQIGWVLELPPAGSTGTVPSRTYTVQPGDTLWSIAEHELGEPGRFVEIADLNHGRPQADGLLLTDPDLIQPGWELHLPEAVVDEPLPAPEPATTPAPPSPPDPTTQAGSTAPEPPSSIPSDDTREAPSTTQPTPGSGGPTAIEPPSSATDPSQAPAPDPHRDDGSADDSGVSVNVPVVAGVTGATVLATGLMLHLRRLRRRRTTATARARWSPVLGRSAESERAIAVASDLPLVRWAGQELAALVTRCRVRHLARAAPVAVEVSVESGIELLWDRPVPGVPPPPPWTSADGGWAWRLPYDADAPVPADERPAPLPALVTIGERDGRQLLVDLEAFGSISLTGDATRTADLGRAIALELGAGDDLADAFVSTVGLDVAPGDHLPRLCAVSASEAHDALGATVSAVGDALERSDLSSSFELRVGHDDTHLEAVVVIADLHDAQLEAAEFVDASPPRRGVASVLLGHAEHTGAKIVLASDGTARLDPLGVTFRVAGLPAASSDDIAELLESEIVREHVPLPIGDERGEDGTDTAAEPVGGNGQQQARLPIGQEDLVIAETPRPGPVIESGAHDAGPHESGPSDDDDDLNSADGQLVVRVLGPPRVDERPNLRRRDLALVAYLACRGGPVHASSIQNAIWGGRAVQGKTFWNLVARTRAALGTLDGEPLMPPADRSRNTLRLSERVTTDFALLRALYERAVTEPSGRAIELLQEALVVVEGEPFDAVGYDWAHHDHQYVAEASALIEQAVEHLVDLTTQAGDLDIAREALVRGLRGLPGNEVLYRARMRLEHDAGNLAGVKAAWDELVTYLDDLDAEPSDATELLYRELVGTTRH